MSNSSEEIDLILNQKYTFYDKNGFVLGIGIWKGNYIEEIPKTCGCNGIQMQDVDLWVELQEYDADMIKRMLKK